MAEITTPPVGLASTNALDQIDDDLLSVPAAYLALGSTPAALEDPPAYGDKVTLVIRARCVAEHGPIERKEGERRYVRTMAIQAIWKQGDPEPPDEDADQPGLFDEGDETGAE